MCVVMCVNWNSRAGLANPAKLDEYKISGLFGAWGGSQILALHWKVLSDLFPIATYLFILLVKTIIFKTEALHGLQCLITTQGV